MIEHELQKLEAAVAANTRAVAALAEAISAWKEFPGAARYTRTVAAPAAESVQTPEPTPEPAPAPEPEQAKAPEPTPEPAPEPTFEDLTLQAQAFVKAAGGRAALSGLLKKFGASRLSDIPAANRVVVIAEMKDTMEAM